MCVFAINDWRSFELVNSYISKIRLIKGNDAPIILIGNKADLRNKRQIEQTIINNYVGNQGLPFIETSAKTSEGVRQAFFVISKKVCLWKETKSEQELNDTPSKSPSPCCQLL